MTRFHIKKISDLQTLLIRETLVIRGKKLLKISERITNILCNFYEKLKEITFP